MDSYLFRWNRKSVRYLFTIGMVFLILLSSANVGFAGFPYRPHADDDELIWVAMVHRHGDRNPLGSYPTDPHKDYKWRGGMGALSQAGIRQLYIVGANVRLRYEKLKPKDGIYSQETVHAIVSDLERTKMSAASMHAGFWSSFVNARPLPILWQPIPFEVIPAREDYILYQADPRAKCPKYERILNELINNPPPDSSIYQFNKKNAKLYEYLSRHMGLNVTNLMAPSYLSDLLFIQETNGLKLPAWTSEVYPQPLYDVRVRSFQLSTETDFMTRMRAGPLITHIYNEMLRVVNGETSRKIITYSAHDTTIHNILTALKIYEKVDFIASYGALLAFELYRSRNIFREDTVRMVYYANTTVKTPQKLKIPGCPSPCYFSDFQDLIDPLLITDYYAECE